MLLWFLDISMIMFAYWLYFWFDWLLGYCICSWFEFSAAGILVKPTLFSFSFPSPPHPKFALFLLSNPRVSTFTSQLIIGFPFWCRQQWELRNHIGVDKINRKLFFYFLLYSTGAFNLAVFPFNLHSYRASFYNPSSSLIASNNPIMCLKKVLLLFPYL